MHLENMYVCYVSSFGSSDPMLVVQAYIPKCFAGFLGHLLE
jgi:hypothetical protein